MNHPVLIDLGNADTVGSIRSAWKDRSIHFLWLSVFCVIFGPTLVWLWHRWTMSIWHNGHGLLVPFIVAFLIRDTLRQDRVRGEDASAWGFLFLIPGVVLVVIDSAIRTQLLSAFALVLCLPGLSLLLLGARRTGALAFPWIIALFMLPIPAAFIEGILVVLRTISATGSEHVLALLGIPVLREQTTLHLAQSSLVIVDACSGFSTLYASVTLSLILAYLASSPARQAVLLLAAFPCAIGSNILRCSLLALLVERQGSDVLKTPLHPLSGFLSFGLALVVLLVLAGFRNRRRSRA